MIFLKVGEIEDFINMAIKEAEIELSQEEKKEIQDKIQLARLKGRYHALLELYYKFIEKYREKDNVEGKRIG